jgi:transcriptional regulator with PAS, ATPase and Fis domain
LDSRAIETGEIASSLLAGDVHRAAEMAASAIEEYEGALENEAGLDSKSRIEVRLKLAHCYHVQSRYADVSRTLAPLLSGELDAPDRARILSQIGWADFFLGDVESCLRKCEEAVSLLLPSSDHADLARCLRWLGYALKWSGRVDEASDRFRDALAAARRSGDAEQQAFCLESLGNLSRLRGRYAEAVSFHEESLACNRARGSAQSIAFDHLHLSLARLYFGHWSKADEDLRSAREAFEDLGHERGGILVATIMSRLHRRRGNLDAAQDHAARAHALATKTNYKRAVVLAREELGDLRAEHGDHRGAAVEYREALKEAEEIAPAGDLVYEICWRLARACLHTGHAEEAELLAAKAVELARASSDRRELGNGLATLALVRHRQAKPTEAAELVREALSEFQTIQAPFELAETHMVAATVLGPDTNEVALGHLLDAQRLYRLLGAEKAHARVRDRIAAFRRVTKTDTPRVLVDRAAGKSIVIADARMASVAELCRRLGRVDSTVLLEGETGTGKEILARLIHESGERASEPFVAVNCAALPGSLLETELFGHKRGAFTGAVKDHEGMLAHAGAGTVLLDEVDKSSVGFQAKLLRVIEERMIRPVGSARHVPLRARTLCASNRDLRRLVKDGLFLEDLYFRLSPFRIVVPPLRERTDGIAALVELFVQQSVGRLGSSAVEVSEGAMIALRSYAWPGNVRELRNVVERAFFLAQDEGVIERWHLPAEVVDGGISSDDDMSLPRQIERLERREIERALQQAKGVKTEAARLLGVSRKGLQDRLRRLGMA